MAKFSIFKQKISNSNNIQSFRFIEKESLFSETKFMTLFKNHPDAVCTLNKNGEIINYNDAVKRLFGYTDEDLTSSLERYFYKNHKRMNHNHYKLALNGSAQNFQSIITHKNGRLINVDVTYVPIMDQDMETIVYAVVKDITKSKMLEIKLHESERRFENIYDNLSLGIRSFDVQKGEIIMTSLGIGDVTGYPPENFRTINSWESIIHKDDLQTYLVEYSKLADGISFNLQYRIIHKNGEMIWVQDKTIPVFDSDGSLIRIDGIVSNISDQKEYEKRIKHLAYHDPITDLPNRTLFESKINSLIELSGEKKEPFSIMYLDLDRFKNINKSLGHKIGDQLLQKFSQRISKLLKKSSLFSRMDGDEFGIVIWDYAHSGYPESLAKTIIDSLNKPFMIEGFELFMTASIGISAYPSNGSSVEEIFKNADAALYRAKVSGKNHYQIYSSNLNISSFKQYDLERDLRKSITNEQLVIHFQPRVDTMTGKMVSAEALVRWEHPVWGLVSPKEFIPLAEETGFINEIGDWVLKQVCHYISEWERNHIPVVPISINITAQRFLRNDWKSTIINTIKDAEIDPALIELEMTETTLIQHEKEVEAAFRFLSSFGIKMALDDFGTGYSSLTHIKDFSINTIKIDQSFIKQITITPNVEVIIKSIIFMAKGLNMNIVAEGVETMEQLAFLKQQECHEIQGYLFSKPVTEKEFQSLLKRVILKPTYTSEKINFPERRKFSRVNLVFPLSSQMTLTSIQGQRVELGKTEVLIEDIGAGGLKFLSTIQLPIRPDILFQFEVIIMGQPLTLHGYVVWKNEIEDIFQYGLQFLYDEDEKVKLMKIFNYFSLQLKNNPLLPNCHFIKEDKMNYLKKVNLAE